MLQAGHSPFLEPGLEEMLGQGLTSGLLEFTADYATAMRHAEYVFLTVDTPMTPAGGADLSSIRSAARSIKGCLGERRPIIINKSTSPIGTGETIESILSDGLAGDGPIPSIVSNPEFLREGRAVRDFLNPDLAVQIS